MTSGKNYDPRKGADARKRYAAEGRTPYPLDAAERATPEECEFLRAVDRYRTSNHRKFLTALEHLRLLVSLGYRRSEPVKGSDE